MDLEKAYRKYMDNLGRYLPDGITEIDLELINSLGLIDDADKNDLVTLDDENAYNFYVIEEKEKLTLFNQKYTVWIVPQLIDTGPATLGLIGLNDANDVNLQIAFSARGVYNQSNVVLRVIEKLMEQIDDNEKELSQLCDSNDFEL